MGFIGIVWIHWIGMNPVGFFGIQTPRFPDLTLGPWGPNTNVFFKQRGSIYSGGLPPEARHGYQPQLPQLILAVTI